MYIYIFLDKPLLCVHGCEVCTGVGELVVTKSGANIIQYIGISLYRLGEMSIYGELSVHMAI